MSDQSLIPVPSGNAGLGRGIFEPDGRQVSAGRCIEWLQQGWELFKKNPGIWIAIEVILAVILIILTFFIPLVGPLAAQLLFPVFIGGLMLGCHALAQGGQFGIDTLFAGFRRNTGNLVLVGLLNLVGSFVIGLVFFVMALFTAGGALFTGAGKMTGDAVLMLTGGMLIALLIVLALGVLLMMAFYFAPLLVVFRNVGPFEAMKASFSACLKNFLPFLIYGVIVFVLGLIAAIPFGLGFLVLGPVLIGAGYASYMDIFE